MSAHSVGPGRERTRQQLGLSAVALMLLLQVGCVTGAPLGRGMLGGTAYRRLTPAGFQAVSPREEPRASGSGGGAGERPVSAEAVGRSWAREPEGGARHEEEARERARWVEEARAGALVQAAQGEGRDPRAAREAEVDRALARVVGLCSGVEEVGAVLAFTFWVEGGALTLVGYGEESGGGSVGRPVDAEGLARVLRHVLTEFVGRRTGEVVLRLRREEGRWAVDYDATRQSPRPAEARTLPVRIQGTPADTFLAFHETARERLRAVQVPAGGAMRVEFAVRLEDGRLVGWELREVQRTREGPGGRPLPLSPEVAGQLVQTLLPFSEGLGTRTVQVVLRAEHRLGEAGARGRVESARVERPPAVLAFEPSWYRSMHEAILLRWREGVVEGSAWLAQKGVEQAALWYVGSMAAKGLGFFAMKGLEWVPRALGREPEVAAGWLRTALKRLSGEEKAAFEQLWRKVMLDGEQALSRSERKALQGLFVRLEQAIQQPLSDGLKGSLRQDARAYYAELYPQFAKILKMQGKTLPIHHRRPLQYAHLFPDENINAGENLAMLQTYVHEEINFLWARFRKARPNPTADEVRRAAEIIDRQFEPWYHRASDPPRMLKTAKQAREAAWASCGVGSLVSIRGEKMMEQPMALPGLDRLMEVCQRLKLGLETLPPAGEPLRAGSSLEGLPFDPVLASVYARLSYAAFATELVGIGWILNRSDDQVHELEAENNRWRGKWWNELGEPVIVFGGDIYTYVTVPGFADGGGRQPVVRVDTYEYEPKVMPIASNVDRFFDSYSRYLEALVADPRYQESGETDLLFPWHATEILARDERLVELMRAGRFDSLMKNVDDETRGWAAKVMGTQV